MKKHLSLNRYHQAVFELIFAGAIWGVSFVLVKWALVDFSTSSLLFWRFLLAFVLGEFLFFIFQRALYKSTFSDFKLAFTSGLSLGAALLFQTHGLKYTTATNSSFITSLYVVMIPVASYFYFKKPLKLHHFYLSLIAFLGMGLLLDLVHSGFQFNYGDLLTLGAAVASTFHIINVGIGSRKMKNGFRFNTFQTFWALALCLPFLMFEIQQNNSSLFPNITHASSLLSILGLSFFVSLGAFYLQIKAQKELTDSTTSMLCLLEGPYSFIFASVFLQEKLNGWQLLGAFIILMSSALSVYLDRPLKD